MVGSVHPALNLSLTFAALADPTRRRRILAHLALGERWCHRACTTLFHVAAGRFQTRARARKRRTGPPSPPRARAFDTIAGCAYGAGVTMDRGISPLLGRQPGSIGRISERASGEGRTIMTSNKATQDYAGREFIITREFRGAPGTSCSEHGRARNTLQLVGAKGIHQPCLRNWDARPGKRIFTVVMRGPNGEAEYPMGGERSGKSSRPSGSISPAEQWTRKRTCCSSSFTPSPSSSKAAERRSR